MEACTLPQFNANEVVSSSSTSSSSVGTGLEPALEAFRTAGAVQLRGALSEETCAAVLAHINATLAHELRLQHAGERAELKQSLMAIVGELPTTTRHSVSDIVDYMLGTWPITGSSSGGGGGGGSLPELDDAINAFFEVAQDPELDSRIDQHITAEAEAAAARGQCAAARAVHNPAIFGNVHSKGNRWDFRLDLDSVVSAAAAELMSTVGPFIQATHAGSEATLCELSSIVSDPGSEKQPLHSDTQIDAKDDVPENHIVTCFVALQPIDPSMGPTVVIPGSHNQAVHAQFGGGALAEGVSWNASAATDPIAHHDSPAAAPSSGDDSSSKEAAGHGDLALSSGGASASASASASADAGPEELLADASEAQPPARQAAVCVCNTGDAVIMDSRALHFGGSNVSSRRRVLLYMSFHNGSEQRRAAFGSTLSLLPEYVGRFGLGKGNGKTLPPWTP
eukprot:INCI16242.11.p2 GENE.INCI16242.11~~INCI16242.11.p2  ORF type:complete len:452 (-),score=103.18 INCI16242.11:2223-3578(-)